MPTPLDLKFQSTVDELVAMPNIADKMSVEDRQVIGLWAKNQYDVDKASRVEWERDTAESLKLALQVSEAKTYPWPNASNVKFPLITVAALKFHARAYASLVPPSGIVKAAPVGYNPPQERVDVANRVGAHMSYQLQRCTSWESETDRALLIVPIVGCAFKKTDYDPVTKKRDSCLVLPQNLVVNYWTKTLDTAPAISEYFTQTSNEVRENVLNEIWLDNPAPATASAPPTDPVTAAKEKAQGVRPPEVTTRGNVQHFIEQHTSIDLDNDGYEEPYIVTFDRDTGFVRAIVARYLPSGVHRKDDKAKTILRIDPVSYYTKLPFIPSPDGGFYDKGFGHLLGPCNEAVNSLINQLIDAGTMANLGGGFLGRGMRIKKGDSYFQPREWKTVDSVGDDIAKNIYPLPVRDPSQVLLDLMIYLVGYAERIAAANEVQMGEMKQHNIKSEAFRIADENGAQIYAAIFKRLWRAIGDEFRLFYALNARIPPDKDYAQGAEWFEIQAGDYSVAYISIDCAADPDAVTDIQRQRQAVMIYNTEAQEGRPTLAAKRRLYKAYNVPDIDELLPKEEPPPTPNAQLISANAKMMQAQASVMKTQTEIMMKRATLQLEWEKLTAEIMKLYAEAELAVANADAADDGAKIAALNANIAMMKEKREGIFGIVELLTDLLANSGASNEQQPQPAIGASTEGVGREGEGGEGASLLGMASRPSDDQVLPISL